MEIIMTVISKSVAAKMITSYNGSNFFTVKFIKRTTGKLRTMNCRKGVRQGVKGVGLPYDPAKKNLVGVWDAQGKSVNPANDFRMISLEDIKEISMNGMVSVVE